MPARRWSRHPVALLFAGALALHQLRYGLASGEPASGHAYLACVLPLVPLVLAAAATRFGGRVRDAWRGSRDTPARRPSLVGAWASAAASLLLIHVAQEGIEAALTHRHAGALLAGGGMTVLLAIGVGLVIALLLRGGQAVLVLAARRAQGRARGRRTRHLSAPRRRKPRLAVPASLLGSNLAGRAPPLLLA